MLSAEQDLLSAVLASPHDDDPRLRYAAWLESRGDARGEYLRIQCELVRTWSYETLRKDLCLREIDLRSRMDADWLACVRRCTTPPAPIDVTWIAPELRSLQRATVRLHPRPGATTAEASKIGGLFVWPGDEPWPVCPDHDAPCVTGLQLRKGDFPELPFPQGADLMQVLWCPDDHDDQVTHHGPRVKVIWRQDIPALDRRTAFPDLPNARFDPDETYIPRPCVLHPERILDLPWDLDELIDSSCESPLIKQAVAEALACSSASAFGSKPDDFPSVARHWLGAVEGTKIGGYPRWHGTPRRFTCACGKEMAFLLSFSTDEWDGDTWGRWCPIEDRCASLSNDSTLFADLCNGPAWRFGDLGSLYVFICRECDGWPTQSAMIWH